MTLLASYQLRGLSSGVVTGVTSVTGGSGYSEATVEFAAPDLPGGRQATGTVVLSGEAVSDVTITDPGSGYSSAPAVTFDGDGSSAAATATITAPATLRTHTIERHSDGSWRLKRANGAYIIYDGNDANANALLEHMLTNASGIPTGKNLFGNTGLI